MKAQIFLYETERGRSSIEKLISKNKEDFFVVEGREFAANEYKLNVSSDEVNSIQNLIIKDLPVDFELVMVFQFDYTKKRQIKMFVNTNNGSRIMINSLILTAMKLPNCYEDFPSYTRRYDVVKPPYSNLIEPQKS